MAKRFTLQVLSELAKRIGGSHNKWTGTRTNINFLGKGPTRNPLFQSPISGLEGASEGALGSREALISAVNDAMGYASAGKLNSIQTEILGRNFMGIDKILHPPPLPSASITPIAPGIEGLKRFPKETHKFMGRPLKDKDFVEIDKLVTEGKIPGSQLPEPGPGDVAAFTKALDQKTGMSRAIARNLLLKDTRLKIEPEDLFMLREGKGEPLDMLRKYYGESIHQYDDFLNSVNIEAARPDEFAEMILKNVKLIPQFAAGGLARILEL